MNEETSAAKAKIDDLSATTAIETITPTDDMSLSVTVKGRSIAVSSQKPILSVNVYDLAGTALYHSESGGESVEVFIPTTTSNAQGVYVICAEIDGGVVSRKLIVR